MKLTNIEYYAKFFILMSCERC